MNQPSLRKTRAVVSQAVDAINQHTEALKQFERAHNALAAKVKDQSDLLDSLLGRSFLGRLKLLLTGK